MTILLPPSTGHPRLLGVPFPLHGLPHAAVVAASPKARGRKFVACVPLSFPVDIEGASFGGLLPGFPLS